MVVKREKKKKRFIKNSMGGGGGKGKKQKLFERAGFLIKGDKIWGNSSKNAASHRTGEEIIFHSIVMVYNWL